MHIPQGGINPALKNWNAQHTGQTNPLQAQGGQQISNNQGPQGVSPSNGVTMDPNVSFAGVNFQPQVGQHRLNVMA